MCLLQHKGNGHAVFVFVAAGRSDQAPQSVSTQCHSVISLWTIHFKKKKKQKQKKQNISFLSLLLWVCTHSDISVSLKNNALPMFSLTEPLRLWVLLRETLFYYFWIHDMNVLKVTGNEVGWQICVPRKNQSKCDRGVTPHATPLNLTQTDKNDFTNIYITFFTFPDLLTFFKKSPSAVSTCKHHTKLVCISSQLFLR